MGARPRQSRLLWLSPLAFLGAVGLGAWIVLARPLSLFLVVLVTLAALPIAWVLVSALWPARAERRCPGCGRDGLARLDARATHGLGCTHCGWHDASASAWLLAEEEGGLEELVRAGARAPAVDSSRRAD